MTSPFDFKTKAVEAKQRKSDEDVKAEISKIAESAKSCVNMPEFREYKTKYEGLERKVINNILDYTVQWQKSETADLNKYAVKVMMLITKINALRTLLDSVNLDANRGEAK